MYSAPNRLSNIRFSCWRIRRGFPSLILALSVYWFHLHISDVKRRNKPADLGLPREAAGHYTDTALPLERSFNERTLCWLPSCWTLIRIFRGRWLWIVRYSPSRISVNRLPLLDTASIQAADISVDRFLGLTGRKGKRGL